MVRALQKLFVSNLPWQVGSVQLKKFVEEFGRVVSATVIFDKKTGLSAKYGFVVVPKETLENLEKGQRHRLEGNNIYFQSSE